MKSNNKKNCIVSVVISVVLYVASMLIGSFVNVLIALNAGYANYSSFVNSGNMSGFLPIFLFGVINHFAFACLTAILIRKYAVKNTCLSKELFYWASGSVLIFAAIILPVIFSSSAGWLMYGIHVVVIYVLGNYYVSKENNQDRSSSMLNIKNVSSIQPVAPVTNTTVQINNIQGSSDYFYCHKCGVELPSDSCFCSKCGTKLK